MKAEDNHRIADQKTFYKNLWLRHIILYVYSNYIDTLFKFVDNRIVYKLFIKRKIVLHVLSAISIPLSG